MRLTSATLLTATGLSALAAAQCDRAKLLEMADVYISAQESGTLDDLTALFTTDFTFRVNNKDGTVGTSGPLGKALKLDHEKTIVDTTQCATFTELVSTGGPYMIGTQLFYSEDGSAVKSMDTIAATTGDWFFNAATTLGFVADEKWDILPEAQRSDRATLQAAGDAYMDMWGRTGAFDEVPWGSPCERTEGAMHFSPDCRVGAPKTGNPGMAITDRRYVIDEEIGSCNILCAFAGAMPDSHEFRLVDGKLVMVHTITV